MFQSFRNLRADEIEVRVGSCSENGASLLLYKDARCDMNILDETFGVLGWQRKHSRDNANCTVSVYSEKLNQWIEKEDTGTESYTEQEKGLASDSFKRACVNWGIGRELYTSPFIWVKGYSKIDQYSKKYKCNEKFSVSMIEISEEKKITALEIKDSKGNVAFSTVRRVEQEKPQTKPNNRYKETPKQQEVENVENKVIDEIKARALLKKIQSEDMNVKKIVDLYKVTGIMQLTEKQHENIITNWEKVKECCKNE